MSSWTRILVIVFLLRVCIYNSLSSLTLKRVFSPWNPGCHFIECCFHRESYNPDIAKLERDFGEHLFGQHLAQSIIVGAISGHVNRANPEKPLVLSLHGPTGTGKNYISRLLVKSLFAYGEESDFVTIKMSTKDYAHKHDLQRYKKELFDLIRDKVSGCPHQVFIFDEIENMPAGLLDSIKVFLDYHPTVDGVNYRHAIFIFRSNLAGGVITKYVWNLYEKGGRREEVSLSEMERLIMNEAFDHSESGLYKAKIIDAHLVSHFVPFLPLEASHVRQCIRAEFNRRGYGSTVEVEDEVLAQLHFSGPSNSYVFSVKGCKNVAEKVDVILYKYRNILHRNRREDL